MAKKIYLDALPRYDELCKPYATVIEIDRAKLPAPAAVEKWTAEDFVRRLRHDQTCPDYDVNLRQLVHVAFRLAAEMGDEWRAAQDGAPRDRRPLRDGEPLRPPHPAAVPRRTRAMSRRASPGGAPRDSGGPARRHGLPEDGDPSAGVDAGPDAGTGADSDTGTDPDTGTSTDDGAAADTGLGAVAVTLDQSSFTLATPDLSQRLTATVSGTTTTTVTWSSSNTYIATVNAAGLVTSVSGGDAIITATSTADPTKTATCTVTVAEPNRARAATYIDAKTITSGPIKIIMAGDSLTRTYAANSADQAGWGQVLGQFLTSDATVDNTLSNGGRSSRSFYNEVGRWDQVKARLMTAKTAGIPAFVFIMFGHNDQKKTTDTDGPLYLTFASNNQNGTVAGTYYDYLERYIVETRDARRHSGPLHPLRAGVSGRKPADRHDRRAARHHGAVRRRDHRPRRLSGRREGHRRQARRPRRRHHRLEQDDGRRARRRRLSPLRLHLRRSDARAESRGPAHGRGGCPRPERAGHPDRLREAVRRPG